MLKSLHNGICGNHAGARNLMFKMLRAGYYWPTLERDAKAVVQTCLQCHKFADFAHHPPVPLSIIISPVPFSQWGLDFIGQLPTAPGQFKYVIVDYNTKWIEAEPLTTITTEKVPCEGPKNSTSLRLATPSRLGTKQVETEVNLLTRSCSVFR
ncbi:hypothetical protein ACLB2K_073314 [Fragaria x ananassa]